MSTRVYHPGFYTIQALASPLATTELIHVYVKEYLPAILDAPILISSDESVLLPTPDREALLGLKVVLGLGCYHCPYGWKNPGSMRRHFLENHPAVRRRGDGLLGTAKSTLRDRFGTGALWKFVLLSTRSPINTFARPRLECLPNPYPRSEPRRK